MKKNIIKVETVAEFLARGGVINKLATKQHKRLTPKQLGYQKEIEVVIEPNMSQLPNALKIRYGIKD